MADTGDVRFASRLGAARAARACRWTAGSSSRDLLAGRVDRARSFADPIVANTDLVVHTEETYLAYTGRDGRWGAQFGRGALALGPGRGGLAAALEDLGAAHRARPTRCT